MTYQEPGAAPGLFSRVSATTRGARRTGGLMMIAAVVLLAFNLRPAVNALGVVIPELQEATGISGTVAGLLTALPTMCFAVVGFGVSGISAKIGARQAVLASLVVLTGGQLLRATGSLWALFAGSILSLGAVTFGNVLLPGLIRRYFPTAIGPMTAVYTTMLMIGQTLGAGVTLPVERGLGGTWKMGIGMWAAASAIALVPWIVALVREPGLPRRGRRARAADARDSAGAGSADAAGAGSAGAAGTGATDADGTGATDADGAGTTDAAAVVGAAASEAARAAGVTSAAGATASAEQSIPLWRLLRAPHAWTMAIFFGTQSVQAYVVFGWVPSVLAAAGMSPDSAGSLLAIAIAMGIPISAVVPIVLGAVKRHEIFIVAFTGALAIGYLGLLIMPLTATWLFVALIGFGLGAFPMTLTLLALRARTPEGTTALSGFGQSMGYLIASIGPVGFGILHDISGGFTVPLIALLCTLVPTLITGLVVVRDWNIEDDLS